MDNGRTLTVIARDNSPDNVYVQSLRIDGKPWQTAWLPHSMVAGGATLEFTMGPQPSRFGTAKADRPPSFGRSA